MGLIRSKFLSRLLVLVTAVSALVTTVAPTVAPRASYVSYGDWVRAQASVPTDVLLDEVISRVATENHKSLKSFLDAVLSTYAQGGGDASALFGAEGMERPQLAAYLHSLLSNIAAEAVPVRVFLTPAPIPTHVSDRASFAGVAAGPVLPRLPATGIARLLGSSLGGLSLILLTSLQPQGP